MLFCHGRTGGLASRLDTLPEWLRGSPAKRMCFAHRGSNPLGVASHGVLAQLEACVLSKDEVLGSKPRYSTTTTSVWSSLVMTLA